MSTPHYVLDNREPYIEPEESRWLWWMQNDNPPLARAQIGQFTVETRFNGMDKSGLGEPVPLLFETVLSRPGTPNQSRYAATWQDALDRHDRVVNRIEERERAKKPGRVKPSLSLPSVPTGPSYLTTCQTAADRAYRREKLLQDPQYVESRQLLRMIERGAVRGISRDNVAIENARQLVKAFEEEADKLLHDVRGASIVGNNPAVVLLDEL